MVQKFEPQPPQVVNATHFDLYDSFDEEGPKGANGVAAKVSFIGDRKTARDNIIIAIARAVEIQQLRLKHREVPLTFAFIEGINNRETAEFCVKLKELPDGRAVWCKSGPTTKDGVYLLDTYRVMDSEAYGIAAGIKMDDNGVVLDSVGKSYKCGYSAALQSLAIPTAQERTPRPARAPRPRAPRAPAPPAPAPPLPNVDDMISHPSLAADGIFVLAGRPTTAFMRSDAALGLKLLYAFDVVGSAQPVWYPGDISMAMTGKAAKKRFAARKEKVEGEATVEARWNPKEKQEVPVVNDCYSTALVPPASGYWCIGGSREQLQAVPLQPNTTNVEDQESGSDDEQEDDGGDEEGEEGEEVGGDEEGEEGEEVGGDEEEGGGNDDEQEEQEAQEEDGAGELEGNGGRGGSIGGVGGGGGSSSGGSTADFSFGGSTQMKDGGDAKLWGLTYVLTHALPGQGVMPQVDTWKRLLGIMSIAWGETIISVSRHINDIDKKTRAKHTRDINHCLQDIKVKGKQPQPKARIGSAARLLLEHLRCKDVLHDGHRYIGSDEELYLSFCWPSLTWAKFDGFELMTKPLKTITPTNNNGAADIIKLLLTASTLNRYPTCSTLFIPVNTEELIAVRQRINPLLPCLEADSTPTDLQQPTEAVAAALPNALKPLLEDGVMLFCPIARVELLLKCTDNGIVSNDGKDVCGGYSKSSVNGINSKNVHGTGTVMFHVRKVNADALTYLQAVKKECREWVCNIRLMQAQSDSESQSFAKKENDGRLPFAKNAAQQYKDMRTTLKEEIEAPFMRAINACIANPPADCANLFRGMSTVADLMPCFIGILADNRKANQRKTNGDGLHLITEEGEALARHLERKGFNAHDVASLEAYVALNWTFVVTVRGQAFWENKPSKVFADETDGEWNIRQVIENPLEQKQASSHAGKSSVGNGPLPVDIVAPPELHEVICLILFVCRRLRAIIFEMEPPDLLTGLSGASGDQADCTTYANLKFISRIGRIHLAIPFFGHYSMRNASITAVMDMARDMEVGGLHGLKETLLNRAAQTWHSSRARFVSSYDQHAGQNTRHMPRADMTPADRQQHIQQQATGTSAAPVVAAAPAAAAAMPDVMAFFLAEMQRRDVAAAAAAAAAAATAAAAAATAAAAQQRRDEAHQAQMVAMMEMLHGTRKERSESSVETDVPAPKRPRVQPPSQPVVPPAAAPAMFPLHMVQQHFAHMYAMQRHMMYMQMMQAHMYNSAQAMVPVPRHPLPGHAVPPTAVPEAVRNAPPGIFFFPPASK
ncbi:hypothetical protein JKP88DRAFT_325938 [Tribonema minus]|uniref:Uncharacterized protein n=1 Tax=Tribonema minus TaxID=303371 RepID=A0A835Z092_9STRA|nr:hypothetical protein JKP88DRAFT_325938 [Tribonema minus]